MYILVIFMPFVMSNLVLILGRFLGYRGVGFFTVCGLFISLLSSVYISFEVILNNCTTVVNLLKWIDIGYFNIYFSFYFDTITSVMLFVVCFISLFVHIYSLDYMAHDPNFNRYMAYLSLFTFFMLLLVTADNYLLMFIGWEGVGLSSYLLINFWYLRILANKAAMKAMFVNRVGDLALLIAISLLFFNFLSLKYTVIFIIIQEFINYNFICFGYLVNYLDVLCFFLFFGAMGKSAQLGLHMWLPDAMEG